MKCKQCKTKFKSGVCPACGTVPKRKPFFLRGWFIFLVIIVIGVMALNNASKGEKIIWKDIVLCDMLPEPPQAKGHIHSNSADSLWIKISEISDKQYADYLEACKENGFTVEAESTSSSYYAYNSDGYKLSLSHYGNNSDMGIDLKAPMEMDTITWPIGIAGKQLPTPKSLTGKFNFEYDDHFFVYIGNTTIADYNEYVNACAEKGFNIDYRKGDDYYRADNSEGWHISVEYVGNNVMSIDIDAPDEEVTPSIEVEESSEEAVAEEKTSDGLDPDFKVAMDSYEAFMDEYVAFMKKYKANPTDLSLLTDYADYMNDYAEFVESFEKWESVEMNTKETAYYIEVQARVSKKLLEAAQ